MGLVYTIARAFLSLFGGLIGYFIASLLIRLKVLSDPINLLYLTLLGVLLAFLISPAFAKRFTQLWQRYIELSKKVPPQAILAAGLGTTIALVITVLLNTLLESVPGFTWYWSLLLTGVLVTSSSWFFVVNRHLLNVTSSSIESSKRELAKEEFKAKLIDTSAIIDGRISDVASSYFIDGKVLIPKFVLNELQGIADSSDPVTRSKGRRGLEVLDKLINQNAVETEVISDDVQDVQEVDEKLIRLCEQRNADLITTDYNLNRVAALQGIRVLNVNQLANALRPIFLPGERLSLHLVKEGREPGQGLGYLEDGTMVVVEEGVQFVGSTIDVVVTSHLQTNMGRMIFSRPH